MLSHLTYDIEQFWFSAVMAAEPDMVAYFEGEPADPWRVDAQMNATAMVAAYQESTERSDAIIDALALTARPVGGRTPCSATSVWLTSARSSCTWWWKPRRMPGTSMRRAG
jgi:hypothetical protein